MVSHFFKCLIVISTLLVSVYCGVKKTQNVAAMEKEYIDHFGTDGREEYMWEKVRDWWYMPGEPLLKKFCAEVHELAGYGQRVVDYVFYRDRRLAFRNKTYEPRLVDIIEYALQKTNPRFKPTTVADGSWELREKGGKRYFITNGLRPECVYYLKRVNHTIHYYYFYGEFQLERHVCGIKDPSPFTTPNLEELLASVSPFVGGTGRYSHEIAMSWPAGNESETERNFEKMSTVFIDHGNWLKDN